jgi:hypothetical protein
MYSLVLPIKCVLLLVPSTFGCVHCVPSGVLRAGFEQANKQPG